LYAVERLRPKASHHSATEYPRRSTGRRVAGGSLLDIDDIPCLVSSVRTCACFEKKPPKYSE
jgi:hypothetical protein